MPRKGAILLAALFGLIAVATPVILALHLARVRSESDLLLHAGLLAQDVLRRMEDTNDQMAAALDALAAHGAANPCSDENIRLMVRLGMSSSMLQAVGHIANDRLVCSSYGSFNRGVRVGPPDYVSALNVEIRSSVTFPSAPNRPFLLVNRKDSGYTAIVHRDLIVDVFTDTPGVALGVVGYTSGRLVVNRGHYDPAWRLALAGASSTGLVDGGYVVAIRRSSRYDSAAYAAIPMAVVELGLSRLAAVLVPIGLLAGLVLVLAVVYVARQQRAMPAVIRSALRRNEFFLEYQPIVELRSGAWIGAEALLRWRRPSGELVSPALFIPVAEDTGLIRRITERVARLAARDAAELFRRNVSFHLAVNLSAADLHSDGAPVLLLELAQATQGGKGSVWVEATERSFLNVEVARDTVRALRAAGLRVGIDDFGTGYSGLSYLGSFEFDFLKIDRGFIEAIGTDAPTSHVVLQIIKLSRDLKLEMIAEGVETEEQARYLREHGVQYAQGWLFARPMSLARLLAGLDAKGVPAPHGHGSN